MSSDSRTSQSGLLLILIISWVLPRNHPIVLFAIVVDQRCIDEPRGNVKHFFIKSADGVRNSSTEEPSKHSLLVWRERVRDDVPNVNAQVSKDFPHYSFVTSSQEFCR